MSVSIYTLRNRDVLTLCVLALLLLGIIMVQSASSNVTGNTDFQWTIKGFKHLRFAFAAFATFFAVGQIDYAWLTRGQAAIWRRPIVWIVVVTLAANLLVLVPHVGLTVNGARRWLPVGPVQIQPLGISAKWGVVIFSLAYWLTYRPVNFDKFTGFLVTMIPIGMICLLVIIQDFGTATLIALVCPDDAAGRAGVKLRHLLITVPPVLAIGLWFVMHKEYRWRRVTAFADPYAAPQREGYHMIQSLFSFSTGGITGRGLGNGIPETGISA